ncbi:MAG: PIG-L family deacetylase, partial [Anaerolineales bacterium]|nr:PIG-L family deacetylase [Anaerolineales bacterium]
MNILAFFAHPDDETMLAGGTLALLARNGASVHYLCATRGEGGELGEPPLCTLEDLGAVRTRELKCAVRVLGGKSLTVLDYVDPRVGPDEELYPYTEDISALTSEIIYHIKSVSADVVITHGSNGEYGHPAHVISHQAAKAALAMLDGRRPTLLTVSAVFSGHP